LNIEIKARKIPLTALDQAEKFYKHQRRDVKKVVYVSNNRFLIIEALLISLIITGL
jgi:hypothetical protein